MAVPTPESQSVCISIRTAVMILFGHCTHLGRITIPRSMRDLEIDSTLYNNEITMIIHRYIQISIRYTLYCTQYTCWFPRRAQHVPRRSSDVVRRGRPDGAPPKLTKTERKPPDRIGGHTVRLGVGPWSGTRCAEQQHTGYRPHSLHRHSAALAFACRPSHLRYYMLHVSVLRCPRFCAPAGARRSKPQSPMIEP